jgi:hypothetical protein
MSEITSINDHINEHCQLSMCHALADQRFPLWKRSLKNFDDVSFVQHGIRRCITIVNSGRHYLQNSNDILDETISHSTYFNALKSERRMLMVIDLEKQSYQLHSDILASAGIDYLSQFPELDEYSAEAADGHFINHACHTDKNKKGKVFAAGFIYALNLRNGLLRPLCVVTNGTERHQEIPAFRNYIEGSKNTNSVKKKQLYVYDKAITDFSWWDNQKTDNNYMISVLKENSTATFVESIDFDENNDINIGVESYSIYQSNGIKFHIIKYRDPETGILHKFISTLDKSINPGCIAMLYYKRWTIEKTFNNSKSDFAERKAWSSNMNALNSQMCFTTMAYNLVRVFEETSKINKPELVHPSDKKNHKKLQKRQKAAQEKGGFVNPLFFHARIVRICSFTIRTIQNAIVCRRPLMEVIDQLASELIPREDGIVEHP